MSNMIERVARALVDTDRGAGTYDRCKSEGIWQSEIVMWEFRARTAIEAMRNPTDAMENAGDNHAMSCAKVWMEMIDAALKEQTK